MTKSITALYARTQFGSIMQKASQNSARYVVGKRGEPKVVIMGVADFIKTMAPEPAVLTMIGLASTKKGTSKLTMQEIDAEIAVVRANKRKAHAA